MIIFFLMKVEGVYKVTHKMATNPIFVRIKELTDGQCSLECINDGAMDIFGREVIEKWLNGSRSDVHIIEKSDEFRAHQYKKVVLTPFEDIDVYKTSF